MTASSIECFWHYRWVGNHLCQQPFNEPVQTDSGTIENIVFLLRWNISSGDVFVRISIQLSFFCRVCSYKPGEICMCAIFLQLTREFWHRIRATSHPPHPTPATCTASEIFTSMHKTAALPPVAPEYFSFPLKEMRNKKEIFWEGGGERR